jgi:DNA-binding transcriptional ArsR family regulator
MEANIAVPAGLIGDPVRAAMLTALWGDRALPANALAWAAKVSAQSASNHLAKLVAGGLVTVTAQGRHRYYRLAGPQVAYALEALAVLGPAPVALDPPRDAKARRLRDARTCYDHLAGRLGVALADALEAAGLIESDGAERYRLTDTGREKMAALGVDLTGLRLGPKGLARPCIDWTERRRHLAGPLAAALLGRFFELGWIARGSETRAIVVTPSGRQGFRDMLGVELELPAAA